jgi:UDP-N-acetyl-D-glucosamine dehydrogenase
MWTRFIELAGEVNTSMPRYVVSKVTDALNDVEKSVKGAKVLVLGLSYKENIDDDRESPSYELIEYLQDKGALVDYCDPYFPQARHGRRHSLNLSSVPCDNETFRAYDALLVSTAHSQFKDAALYAGVPLVIDTRNIVKADPAGPHAVVRA